MGKKKRKKHRTRPKRNRGKSDAREEGDRTRRANLLLRFYHAMIGGESSEALEKLDDGPTPFHDGDRLGDGLKDYPLLAGEAPHHQSIRCVKIQERFCRAFGLTEPEATPLEEGEENGGILPPQVEGYMGRVVRHANRKNGLE